MKRTTMYAIVGQGIFEDDSLNSVACNGYGPIKDVMIERSKIIANEYVQNLQKEADPADNVGYDIVVVDDTVTVMVNGYPDSRWSVVEINP